MRSIGACTVFPPMFEELVSMSCDLWWGENFGGVEVRIRLMLDFSMLFGYVVWNLVTLDFDWNRLENVGLELFE